MKRWALRCLERALILILFAVIRRRTRETEMEDAKPFWQSKGVIGGLVAFAAGVAGIFGIGVPEAAQGEITTHVHGLVVAAGGLLAMYGRLKADRKIK
jgi:hypothetical protein